MSNPDLMLSEISQNIMGEIFHGRFMNFQKDLLKVFLILLRHDQIEHKGMLRRHDRLDIQKGNATKTTDNKVDMSILVGFSEDLGKSNVVSSIVQLFLTDILDLILSDSREIVVIVSDILEIIVLQGLGHPLSVCCLKLILSVFLILLHWRLILKQVFVLRQCLFTEILCKSILVLFTQRTWNALK